MTSTNSNQAFALFAVIIIVLAAFVVGVMLKGPEKKDEPQPEPGSEILGTYEMVDYNRMDSVQSYGYKVFYETGDGVFDGMKICIDSYDDGIISGKYQLHGKEYGLTGYYDLETGIFGYGCNYDYTPEKTGENVVDSVKGYIQDGTMYARGTTISTREYCEYLSAFNYTLAKEGVIPVLEKFQQVIFKDNDFSCGVRYETWIDSGGNVMTLDEDWSQYTVSLCDIGSEPMTRPGFNNGTYFLIINGDGFAAATTLYQDETVTYLIGVVSIAGYYHSFLICVEGDQLYLSEDYPDDSGDTKYMNNYVYYMSTEGSSPKQYATKNIDGLNMTHSIRGHSLEFGESSLELPAIFDKKLDNRFLTPMKYNGDTLLVSVLPYLDTIHFNNCFEYNGTTYHSEVIGHFNEKGEIVTCGIAFSDDGDIIASIGMMT